MIHYLLPLIPIQFTNMTKTSNKEPLVLAFAETFHHTDPIPDLDMDAMFPPLLSRQQPRSTSLCHTNVGESTFVQVASHRANRLHAPLKQSQFRSGLESQKYNNTAAMKTPTPTNPMDHTNDNNTDPLWEYHARKEESVLKALRDNRRMKQHRQELSDRLLRRYVRLACKDYDNDEDISDDSPTAIKLKQEERLEELLQSLPKHYFAPGKDMSRVEYVKHLMCNVEE